MGIVISEALNQATVPSDVTVKLFGSDVVSMSSSFAPPGNTFSIVATSAGASDSIIYSNVPDNSSQPGNGTVSASVMFQGAPAATAIAVRLAVGGQWIHSAGNDTAYELSIQNAAGANDLYILKYTNGAYNGNIGLAGVNNITWVAGVWYTLTLYRAGSWLAGTCQRSSDSFWLNSGGTWQANYIVACSGTDTAVGGPALSNTASYGGIVLGTNAGGTPYGGNLVFRDQKTTLPAGVIKGMNLAPDFVGHGETDWPALWNRFITSGGGGQGGIYSQIQMAKAAGCNCIRLIGASKGVWQGVFTQAQYLSALQAIVSYCKSQNLYFYLTDQAQTGYDPTGTGAVTQATLFASITALAVAVAQAVAGFPNILGYDIRQECDQDTVTGIVLYNHTTTTTGTFAVSAALELALTYQVITAVRAAVPNMPLTCSMGGNSTSNAVWSYSFISQFAYLFDYWDQHVYYSALAGESATLYSQIGTSGKKLFIGEFGDNMGLTESGGASRNTILNNIWTNVVLASYAGQPGCFGGLWWTSIPQNTSGGANDFGLWDGTWNGTLPVTGARNPEETTYAGLSSQSVSFSSGRRRRR